MKIYSKSSCPYCQRLLSLLGTNSLDYEVIDVVDLPEQDVFMKNKTWSPWVPQVLIENIMIYDYDTEETLVMDIQTILWSGPVSPVHPHTLTSQFVFLNA